MSRENALVQTGTTYYIAQLGLPDKGHRVGYELWLGSMNGMGVRTCARCAGLVPSYGQDA